VAISKHLTFLARRKPITFHYETDKTIRPEFDLIAEEALELNPDLVVRDKKGEIYTVRYDAVNAMLLNEFLKEHKAFVEEQRKVQEQGAMIARQQKQIDALTAGLQKVSAQLELTKSAPRTVQNNQ
jgi:septal ring factor EnvC (AmiA/AmiB activator)